MSSRARMAKQSAAGLQAAVEETAPSTAPPGAANATPAGAQPPRPSRLFPVVLAMALGLAGGYQLGQLVHPGHGSFTTAGVPSGHTHGGTGAPVPTDVGGLAVSAGGYTLVPETTTFTAGATGTLRFRIVGTDGAPVTSYATVHEKPLHLILARRDLGGYQHLHPILGADGVWTTALMLPAPGIWRAYADFAAFGANGGQTAYTLGVDLTVAGGYSPVPLPAPARESTVDGLVVTFEGTPRTGGTTPLTFRVWRDGAPISALEPYLGSYGHLVVLREGDLGYLHIHADPPTSANQARFWLTAPSVGRYRMFFDFKVGEALHTAAFTLQVT